MIELEEIYLICDWDLGDRDVLCSYAQKELLVSVIVAGRGRSGPRPRKHDPAVPE